MSMGMKPVEMHSKELPSPTLNIKTEKNKFDSSHWKENGSHKMMFRKERINVYCLNCKTMLPTYFGKKKFWFLCTAPCCFFIFCHNNSHIRKHTCTKCGIILWKRTPLFCLCDLNNANYETQWEKNPPSLLDRCCGCFDK